MEYNKQWENYTEKYQKLCMENDVIPDSLFKEYGVNRGLRDINGNGVLTGLTNISRIDSFCVKDGKKVPCDGKLWYRGYNVTGSAIFQKILLVLERLPIFCSLERRRQ